MYAPERAYYVLLKFVSAGSLGLSAVSVQMTRAEEAGKAVILVNPALKDLPSHSGIMGVRCAHCCTQRLVDQLRIRCCRYPASSTQPSGLPPVGDLLGLNRRALIKDPVCLQQGSCRAHGVREHLRAGIPLQAAVPARRSVSHYGRLAVLGRRVLAGKEYEQRRSYLPAVGGGMRVHHVDGSGADDRRCTNGETSARGRRYISRWGYSITSRMEQRSQPASDLRSRPSRRGSGGNSCDVHRRQLRENWSPSD